MGGESRQKIRGDDVREADAPDSRRRRRTAGLRERTRRAHPDADPGYAAAAAKLEQLVARGAEAAVRQRSGIVDTRAASARRRELRRTIQSVHIAHLAQVGQEAAAENHELGKTFRFKPVASTLMAFRQAAGTMLEEARTHREALVKYGLSAKVLDEFVQLLAQFDAAMALSTSGRARHMNVTEELKQVAGGSSAR